MLLTDEPSQATQEARFITEGDLYRLIFNSKLPTAEKFEEVLPSSRDTKKPPCLP